MQLDALVSSGRDPGERYSPGDLDPAPKLVVRTLGATGGEWETASGEQGRWDAAELPGPVRDSYGAGDSFAAGLTFALGRSDEPDAAVAFAAECAAAALARRGAHGT